MKKPAPVETISPARNFSLTLEDRVRALGGPAAYMRRKREIEDIEDRFVTALRELRDAGATREEMLEAARGMKLTRLADLIARHNRYYPAEANLPIQPLTGLLLERGKPWKPLPPPSPEALVARALSDAELNAS